MDRKGSWGIFIAIIFILFIIGLLAWSDYLTRRNCKEIEGHYDGINCYKKINGELKQVVPIKIDNKWEYYIP